MAENQSSIFNKKATEKLRSPDDLDRYVRVTNPSVWVVIIACAALLAGLLAWGAFGSVTTNVSGKGATINDTPLCFVSSADVRKVHVGDKANVGGEKMTVSDVATLPLSRDEVRSLLKSDYLVSALVPDDWSYQVTFKSDEDYDYVENVPVDVSIAVERIAPLTLILGDQG